MINEDAVFYSIMGFCVGVAAGILIGVLVNDHVWQKIAVKHGAAEWTADEKGGCVFQWKEKP